MRTVFAQNRFFPETNREKPVLLYEVSIWIVSRTGKKQQEESLEEVFEKS